MNYPQSLRYLDSFLNFEKMTLSRSPRWNLERMKFLFAAAGHPEKSFFPVLIAGTKGKGSTGFFLESILNASGIQAGFYSSPHLETPRERIRLNGGMISEKLWALEIGTIQKLLAKHPPSAHLGQVTYFEMMTLLAALVFKRAGVQVGIFEAGMGGRWDAVNAMDSKLIILTPIHLDHEAVLGNTIAKIAREKAAIIRPGACAVISPQTQEALRVIKTAINRSKAKEYHPKLCAAAVGLRGDYQHLNASSAVQAAILLRSEFSFKVTAEGIEKGIQAKGWPGRYEVFHKKSTDWVLDAAHNPISIEALVRNLHQGYANRPRSLIFGTSRDKNAPLMLKILSRYFSDIILTRACNSRSAEISVLMAQAKGHFEKIYPVSSVSEAIEFAKAVPASLIVVTGSFFVIGEARTHVKK